MRRLPEPSARVGNRQFSSLVPREAFNNPLQLRSPMTFNRNLEPLVECVAEHTVGRDMESEDWQKAVALNGLLELEDETYHETVLEFVNRSIETQTSTGQFSYGSLDPRQRPDYAGDWYTGDMSAGRQIGHHVNPAALGPAVLDMYERTGEADYLEAARRQYQYLRDIKRVDGAIPQHGENELWLDSAYMLCPFFSRYGSVCDDPDAFDEAAHQIRTLSAHLHDNDTGLFRHTWRQTPNSFPQSMFWGRGNGWIMAGIVDTLATLPADHTDRDKIVQTFRTAARAIRDRQDASGYWHNTIDDTQTALEGSGTLLFAYAFMKAYEMGILENDAYRIAARDAVEVCCGSVDDKGRVHRIAIPPGGPNAPFGVTSYGQGAFLLAAAQFIG